MLTVGKTLRFHVRGLYSTPALSVGNITINIKLGSTTLATGTASSLLVSAANAGFVGECFITCRSTGASGTVIIMGDLDYALGNNVASAKLALNNGTSTSTIDTTASQAFNATVTWSNDTAGNSVSSLNCVLEALN